ncbi:MAG: hypothetical protein PQJ46_14265 [Spirochaetales bacterium]|nr:hypothetical protein [Spirochaetales bacterium]
MKFKLILLSFNILIVLSFLIVFLLPFFILGADYSADYWHNSWYLSIGFVLVIGLINSVYFINKKLLVCLENEDWQGLKNLLDNYIFEKNKYKGIYIKLYINASIATSSINDIKRLEARLRESAPSKVSAFALPLGMPYLLEGEPVAMKNFYGEFISVKTDYSGWIKWNYCFALLLLKETEEAVSILTGLVTPQKDKLLKLSSLYMLSPFSSDSEVGEIITNEKAALASSMTRTLFTKEVDKQRENVQMLFLSKILNEALDWLYST